MGSGISFNAQTIFGLIGFAWGVQAIFKIREGISMSSDANDTGSIAEADRGHKRMTSGIISLVLSTAAIAYIIAQWKW
jgi:hypothetical protein